MDESIQPSVVKRDWRMSCYDTNSVVRVCTVDSDHGAVRIGLSGGERQDFFELRIEQVDQFWAALESTLEMIRSGGSDGTSHWRGRCYTQWDELSNCVIEAKKRDVLRIAWVAVVVPGARECSFEFRGEQIGVFQAALTAAIKVCHADIAIHGQHWADNETDEAEAVSPTRMTEAEFVDKINKMVAAEAPTVFGMVGEIGDHVDAMMLAWGMKLSDHHTEVTTIGPDHVRASFNSPESAWKVFSLNGKINIWIVPVKEARRQIKAT